METNIILTVLPDKYFETSTEKGSSPWSRVEVVKNIP